MAMNYGKVRGKNFTISYSAKRAVGNVNKDVEKAMKKVAKKIQAAIKSFAPVDTGKLKRSVAVRGVARGNKPRIEVKTTHYGQYVEFGTRNMAAQPYIRPVVKGMRKDWERELKKEAAKSQKRRAKRKKR